MRLIDAHIHYCGDHPDCAADLSSRDFKLLNVCVAYRPGGWNDQRERYRSLAAASPSLYAWCTSFDPPDFRDPGYADRVIAGISADYAAGACGCKVWKNIGMEFRKPSGDYLMIDDPLFHPLFDFLSRAGRPVLMHIGEPRECWLPLDPGSAHYDYYSTHLEWHMYGRAGIPSHESLIAARDRVVERHPRIQFVGAHLGSLEYDLEEIARRLARYPNLMVDTSARMSNLVRAERGSVRDFLLRWADRVIYGSDFVEEQSQASLDETGRRKNLVRLAQAQSTERALLESAGPVKYQGLTVQGLALPARVLQKLLAENARSCYAL
jgi:predicted TIM-barrel fold metal-dependent hydrolase